MDRYIVIKQTATHADALAAIGAADMLRHLEAHIVELEDRFEVRLARDLTPSDVEPVDPGFSYLQRPGRKVPNVPAERITHLATPEGECGAGADGGRMYRILSRMKAYAGPNNVVAQFAAWPRARWTSRVWESLNGNGRFTRRSNLVQLFNPQSARGYALLKARNTDRNDRTKDTWAEPFLEWLRFRGYFEGSAGWFTDGDLRFMCPIPAGIPFDELAAAVASFRDLRLGGSAAKIDCRAVLGLARLLIEGASQYRNPSESIRAIWVTHYKDMGKAHVVIASEQLALPNWFDLRSARQAKLWLNVLNEHDTALRRLTDSHSDEFALLKQYRRTFQLRREESIDAFVTFFRDYGVLLFRRRAQEHWTLPQFAVSSVSSILGRNRAFGTLIRNPGFRAVAAAVRASTMGAQAARYRGRVDHREVRYGLLEDLRRADRLGRGDLLVNVFAFIAAFNSETVRRRGVGIRAMQIQESELTAFRSQVERLPSSTSVGAMLCGLSACLPGRAAAVAIEDACVQAMTA
jgi:hypothetical protein